MRHAVSLVVVFSDDETFSRDEALRKWAESYREAFPEERVAPTLPEIAEIRFAPAVGRWSCAPAYPNRHIVEFRGGALFTPFQGPMR